MKVNTNALQQYANEMKPAISAMLETRDTVRQVADRLMEESIGERFRTPILMSGRDINRVALEMIQLQETLYQIARCYEECENRIADRAEQSGEEVGMVYTGFFPSSYLAVLYNARPVTGRTSARAWERWISPIPWNPGPAHPAPHLSLYCPYPHVIPGSRPGWWRPQNIFRVIWPQGPMFFGRPVPGVTVVLGGTDSSVAWQPVISTDS